MPKKELTAKEKEALRLKYEIAEELGLLEKVEKAGWRGLSSRESGRIGGLMSQRQSRAQKETAEKHSEEN